MPHQHEIRDPIYNFIHFDSKELKVLNSATFQRLRHIHQLALTYLVYPGATHRRFEHSLGVMELAGRVYDIITDPSNIYHDSVRELISQYDDDFDREYWRRALRIAALCHDMGHLPFSHAAEKELLPADWNHEKLTMEIIRSDKMRKIFEDIKVDSEDVAKIAVGPKYYPENLNDWETIISEIIISDAFGVDRIDYLLRDSHHVGVAYGRFDHYRLIDNLRILPREDQNSEEPTLGIDEDGLHAAESLILARYFMFTQVYCHRVRRIYDIHLKDFLKLWLPDGHFTVSLEELLKITDNEVTSALLEASRDKNHPYHEYAQRVIGRKHFRLLYQRNPVDQKINQEACRAIFDAACHHFGEDNVRYDVYKKEGGGIDFPVYTKECHIISSLLMSEFLYKSPVVAMEYVFIEPRCRKKAGDWLEKTKKDIIPGEREN